MIEWYDMGDYENHGEDFNAMAAQAYLILPCEKAAKHQELGDLQPRYPIQQVEIDGRFALFDVVDLESLKLTPEQTHRFQRVMKLLDLSPSLEQSQIQWLERRHPDPVLEKLEDLFWQDRQNEIRKRLEGMFV